MQVFDGFDAPVGTVAERASPQIWPGAWYDATGYGVAYPAWMHRSDYHTGVDLNLPQDADRQAPCYAPADGMVLFATLFAVWGKVIVLRHDNLPEVGTIWSRLAHLDSMLVKPGQQVKRGEPLGLIGNAEGRYAYHLHFDIARVNLGEHPTDWPNTDLQRLLATYYDPKKFIIEHRAPRLANAPADASPPTRVSVTADPSLNIRSFANVGAKWQGSLAHGAVVEIVEQRGNWGRIEATPEHVAGWICLDWTAPVAQKGK